MGPPPPRRQPAARPGTSDSPPGTGMGRGRAGRGGRGRKGRARETSQGLCPAQHESDTAGTTTHPACARVGLRDSREAGHTAAGGGEGGGARGEDERLADLPRRL